MPPEPAFAGAARALIVGHAVMAIALVVAATQHAVIAGRQLRGRFERGLARLYAAATAATYVAVMGLGLLAYPTFRYQVRALVLDRHAPWASNLFDTKEAFAALGLPVVAIALGLACVRMDGGDRTLAWAYAVSSWLVAAIVWFDAFSGFAVAFARGM